jgi:hypothetical protein
MSHRVRFWSSICFAALLTLGLAAPAHAITVLTSTPLSANAADSILCAITNQHPFPISVSIEAIDASTGALIDADSPTLAPGQSTFNGIGGGGFVYCRFTGNFNRGYVRASIQIRSGGSTIAVAPAQQVGD